MSRQNRDLRSFPPVIWEILAKVLHHRDDPHFKIELQFKHRGQAINFRQRFHTFRAALARLSTPEANEAVNSLYAYSPHITGDGRFILEYSFIDIYSTRIKEPIPPLNDNQLRAAVEALRSKFTGIQQMTMQDVNKMLDDRRVVEVAPGVNIKVPDPNKPHLNTPHVGNQDEVLRQMLGYDIVDRKAISRDPKDTDENPQS
jgi:hypothetical protein